MKTIEGKKQRGRPAKADSDAAKIAAFNKRPVRTFVAPKCGCMIRTRLNLMDEPVCKHYNTMHLFES